MKIIDIHIELKRCDKKCLYFEHKSGMGHCDDWDHCNKKDKPIEYKDLYIGKWPNETKLDFPKWCPLKDKDA